MVNVYETLAQSQAAERKYRQMLDEMGFWKWHANEGEFQLLSKKQLDELHHQAERKRWEAARRRERPPLLDYAIAAVSVVYGVSDEDLPRVKLKTEKLNDARDHLCWLLHYKVDAIHLRRLFASHHTTINNWRQRFNARLMADEVRRVNDLLGDKI